MAIAFRSVGTVKRADTGVSGSPQAVSLPSGHVSGDFLLLVVLADDNTGPSAPSGWTTLGSKSAGTSTRVPYFAFPKVYLYYRFDTGSLGASVNVPFNVSSNWPDTTPFMIGWVEAYTGVDTTAPVEKWLATSTTGTAAAQPHPQITTVAPNDWLITIRAAGFESPGPPTYTCSVGTDVEHVDVDDQAGEGLGGASYNSATALSAGAQTIRTTTASRICEWGNVMVSIAIKPVAATNAAFAAPTNAVGTGTAYNATASTGNGGWDLCGVGGLPIYAFAIDWADDGSYATVGDDATGDIISDISLTYGRDQDRQLNPASVGNAAFSLINVDRAYSPEWSTSALFGNLEPARAMRAQVTWAGHTYPVFVGRIDDFNIKVDMNDRSVDFTFLDGLNDLSEVNLSTEVFQSKRTGELIDLILDEVGWLGARDIDLGATVVKFWWAEGTDAFSAINDLVASEGPPAIAFIAPDGTFVFHDRHHRLQNDASITSQGIFSQGAMFDCTAPVVTGGGIFNYTAPFAYAHGWRDIVNSVEFDVSERQLNDTLTAVYTSEDNVSLATGESFELTFSGNDPFMNAITPVPVTDYTTSGAGTLSVTLSRTSGASAKLTFQAIGGSLTILTMQVRAYPISVTKTVKISQQDSGSISTHGERRYPNSAPWANANDSDAIASMILLRYAQRRPTIQLRVVTSDPQHFVQVLQRTVGDRITVINGEMGLDDDFFIERVTHTIQRINRPGAPPVHAVVFGCERDITPVTNPFTFDKRGAGFDDGVFDPIHADTPDSVFIFGDPVQGKFDTGLFGT